MARLLIIEDNATNLGLMSYLLTAAGHTVQGCRDGQTGLEAVRRDLPDLVLCDIQLPRLSGLDVARALRKDAAFSGLPLVAVTALAMRGDREQVLAAGFSGYIDKPIQPEKFVEQVESYLPDHQRGTRLPAGPPVANEISRPVPLAPGAPTVLVVDDTRANLALMRAIFEGAGYRVLTAPDVESGLATMAQAAVDLVISDVHMAGTNGFDFRRAARADPKLADIPFIFVSSSVARDQDRREARELGACNLVDRPVDPSVLLKTALDAIQRRGPPG